LSRAITVDVEEYGMKIEDIEGIGPAHGAKLSSAGVATTDHLLERGGSASGRESLAAQTGQSTEQLLEWVNHVDLMRIDGVGSEYADLLEAAGVDSVPELATRNAANLATALEETNEKKDLVRRVPSEAVVTGWIAEAQTLPKVVTH
jgi:predicted flap endonuclease-1-like 5' DNA nuclease